MRCRKERERERDQIRISRNESVRESQEVDKCILLNENAPQKERRKEEDRREEKRTEEKR